MREQHIDVKILRKHVGTKGYDAVDLSEMIEQAIAETNLQHGTINLFTPNPGCMIVYTEYEPSLLRDLEKLLSNISSESRKAVAEALIGKSVPIPVINGQVTGGVFKQPILIDLSEKPGLKEVVIVLEGIFK